jgi:hypothetical protein
MRLSIDLYLTGVDLRPPAFSGAGDLSLNQSLLEIAE